MSTLKAHDIRHCMMTGCNTLTECQQIGCIKEQMSYLPSYALNAAKTVAVSTDVFWIPIDTAPRGVKIQLLGKGGVATYGTYYGDQFWLYWCPLPKMPNV